MTTTALCLTIVVLQLLLEGDKTHQGFNVICPAGGVQRVVYEMVALGLACMVTVYGDRLVAVVTIW